MKLQMLFSYLRPSPYIHVVWVIQSWGLLQRHDYNYDYNYMQFFVMGTGNEQLQYMSIILYVCKKN